MPSHDQVVHPGTVIFHRSGQFLAGRLSGTAPSTAIALPDIVLLANFLQPAEPRRAIAELFDGPRAQLLPGRPPENLLLQRIDAFRQRGMLHSGAAPEPAGDLAKALTLDDLSLPQAGTAVRRCRLGKNVLLRVASDGFLIDSARDGQTYRIDPACAVLLLGFANGAKPDELARQLAPFYDAERVQAAARSFFERGLLIDADHLVGQAADKPEDALPVRKATAPGWRDIEPDGRIPVYFMPHMENHYPLALGMLYSTLVEWEGGTLLERFQLVPITYLPPDQFIQGPYAKFGPGVWLFSNYMWSDELNLKVSDWIKRDDPRNFTIHGGPSTPSYESACADFMNAQPSVDVAVHGEGELAIGEIFERLTRDAEGRVAAASGLAEVAGITWRTGQGRDFERTPPRTRMRDPDRIPSPYAQGVFDTYEGRIEAAIVETNRGCPFQCTFCDWGSATAQKVSRFEMDRVRGEIEWVGRNEVPVIWVADANFGMLKRDLEIAEMIVDTKRRTGYPREVVVNYTKNANERLAEIIRVFSEGGIIGQGIISIQTSDEQTLEVIKRSNIKTEKYDELIRIFARQGLPLSTDLMIGLPGITPEAFDNDLQRYIDVDVAVKAYPTQLLPNSPMAHPAYMETYGIKTDEQGFLTSCFSYNEEELRRMKQIYEVYVAADGYCALRYVMRFLQWDRDLPAMKLLHDLLDTVRADPDRYPSITWLVRFFNTEKIMPGGWRRFYDEIAAFVRERYGVERDSAFDTALTANELAMPDDTRDYPARIKLDHDLIAWFKAHNSFERQERRALSEYGAGQFEVSDPNGLATIDLEYQQYDTHQYFWELHSAVARPTSVASNDETEAPVQAVS